MKEELRGLTRDDQLQRKVAKDDWAKFTLMRRFLGDKNLERFGSVRVIRILSFSVGCQSSLKVQSYVFFGGGWASVRGSSRYEVSDP